MLINVTNTDTVATFLAGQMDKIMTLMQSGFFEMRNGSVTVHFDTSGRVRKVERHDVFTF